MLIRNLRLFLLATFALSGSILLTDCAGEKAGSALERVQSAKVLTVGTDATYPPFESVDPANGEVVGFDVDLIRALGQRLGATVQLTVVPFDGIIAGLRTSKYDAVISAMTITPERAAQVAFTKPYSAAGQSIAVRANETGLADLADLAGRKIGVQLGTTGEMEARKIPNATAVSFDAIGNAFRDLENGNVDAVIADTPTVRLFQREHGTIRIVGQPLTHEEYGIAVRLEDATLKAALDSGIDALRQSGELRALEQKWGFVE